MKRGSSSTGSGRKKVAEVPNSQKKITHFFTKGGEEDVKEKTKVVPLVNKELTQGNNGANNIVEEITLSDSSEDEVDGVSKYFRQSQEGLEARDELREESMNMADPTGVGVGDGEANASVSESASETDLVQQGADADSIGSDSGDELLSQLDEEEIIRSSQEKEKRSQEGFNGSAAGHNGDASIPQDEDVPFEGSDSGDELLSQLDEDEIINSSPEKRSQGSSNGALASPSNSNLSKVVNLTPIKSVRAKITRYSPLRRLNSPQRPESWSSAGSQPGSSQKKSQTPSQSKSGSPGPTSNQSKSPSGSPVKRKLEFSEKTTTGPVGPFIHYYLRNFMTIVDSVTNEPLHDHLFNDWERGAIQGFRELSVDARCLYVRLFLRKWKWMVASTIKYPKIKENLTPVFEMLYSSGFLVEIKDVLEQVSLSAVLEILDAKQIAELAKQMNLATRNKTKKGHIEAFVTLGNQKNMFGGSSSADKIKKRALAILGATYQLEGTHRTLFSKLFILYSPPQYWEDEQEQSSNEMLKMLFADGGRVLYPQCRINRRTIVHTTREDFTRFHESLTMHTDITSHNEYKNWTQAVALGDKALVSLKEILDDDVQLSNDKKLPSFLRVYKAGSVLTRVVWLAVEAHQKLRKYEAANELIKTLLSQDVYLLQYRGRWYERLAINQKQLKMPLEIRRETLEQALVDSFLLGAHKLCLSDRIQKLAEEHQRKQNRPKKKRKRSKDDDEDEEDPDPVETIEDAGIDLYQLNHELPTRTIEGEKLFNPQSGKSVFVTQQDVDGASEASSVEEFAITNYKTVLGYTWGIHSEGSVVTTIYGLLFWDEIYNDEIDDSFYSPHQVVPLDLNFAEFFQRREGLLMDKLNGIRTSWTMEDVLNVVEKNWHEHFNVLTIVNWSLFNNVETLKSLIKVMGLPVLVDICERLARNYRHHRSGFPDLVVWNDTQFLFAEVKGPGDKLSFKQKIWIDFLLSINAPTEVCIVQAVSNKRIRR